MAAMLTQLPLPLLPAGAAEIAPGVGVVTGAGGGLVLVHGLATFAWDAGDEAGRRLAAVQLVRLRAGEPGAGRGGVRGRPGHRVAVGPGAGRGWGGRAGPGAEGAAAGVEADRRGGGADPRAGRAGQDPGRDRRGGGGVGVQRPQRPGAQPPRPPGRGCRRAGCRRRWPSRPGAAGEAPGEPTAPGGPAGPLPVLPDPVPRGGERAAGPVGAARRGRRPGVRARGAVPAGRAAARAAARWRPPACWTAPARCTGGCAAGSTAWTPRC